jgi:hypothetical protein
VERFAVRADLLGRPTFAALLMHAAQEYRYGHPGAPFHITTSVASSPNFPTTWDDCGAQLQVITPQWHGPAPVMKHAVALILI